jgi:malate synthase
MTLLIDSPTIELSGADAADHPHILTPDALAFVAELHDRFDRRRRDRLADRLRQNFRIGNGHDPAFPDDTAHIRQDAEWQVAGPGPGLEDRRVIISGPVDTASTRRALTSGAKVWLADLEDGTSPTWRNLAGAQSTLASAIRHQKPGDGTPTIVLRPRGWHLPEGHVLYTDRAGIRREASGALVDFGLYAHHNAKALIAAGRGPYFSLPKIESAEEARLWNDVFTFTEERLDLPYGTIRAMALIETLPAAFEMEEILFALRDHCAGLTAGRWDYLFSIIRAYRGRSARFVLPDRNEVTMSVPFLHSYTQLLVQTCHRRGAHAIGGLTTAVLDGRDAAGELDRIAADKRREAEDGFDGTWVANPQLVPAAEAEFDAVLGDNPNQRDRQHGDVTVTAQQLIDVRMGRPITAAGVHENVSTTIRYLESWLRGIGSVVIDGQLEDASIAEISRAQVWQWVHQGQQTENGTPITTASIEAVIDTVLREVSRHPSDRYSDAVEIFREVALGDEFPPFLTLAAYNRYLIESE